MAMTTAAAVTAGILSQARRWHAPNKKQIGCDSAKDIVLMVHLSIFLADDNKNKVNKQSIFSNSFR